MLHESEQHRGGHMVDITTTAIAKFKEITEKENRAGEGIRIYLVPGG